MTVAYIALYNGPPSGALNKVMHYVTCGVLSIRALRRVRYSHAELQINGVCYSSSVRDGGVRAKVVDTTTNRWHLLPVHLSEEDAQRALSIFELIDGRPYDFLGAVGVVLPFVRHSERRYFCFEVVAKMLGQPAPHLATPVSLEFR